MLRKVSVQEARDFCREYNNMDYIETSAMDATNVRSAFETSVQEIYDRRQMIPQKAEGMAISIVRQNSLETQKKSGCCNQC